MNNKGVSVVVAVSIMLAAIVTASVTVRVFIIPELNRETAFAHTQEAFDGFNNLYYEQEATIPLSYSGIPFLSPASFVGQLSFIPTTTIELTANDTKQLTKIETTISNNSTINMTNISKAILNFQNVSVTENFEVNATFTNAINKNATFHLTSKNDTTWTQFQLNVTMESTSSYTYTLVNGDTFEIDIFAPIYNASSIIHNTTTLNFTTNSPNCSLFLSYEKTEVTDITCTARGSLHYDPSNFPRSYLYTPWGLTAIQAGTSSLPSSPQIYCVNNQLILNLYNLTSTSGTISGTGSAKINFLTNSMNSINSSISSLKLRFSSNQYNLTNSVSQLFEILSNTIPENLDITLQNGDNWSEIAITGENQLNLIIHNVEAKIT